MLYYNFNYSGFVAMFGRKDSRRNKILLSFIKDRKIFRNSVNWIKNHNFSGFSDEEIRTVFNNLLINTSSMSLLRLRVMDQLLDIDGVANIKLGGDDSNIYPKKWHSNVYKTDELEGLCEDNDSAAIRYINIKSGKPFKMRASKMFHRLMMEHKIHEWLPEVAAIWLCEDFSSEWQAYCLRKLPQYNLVVDKDFEYIYSKKNYAPGDFHSCMTDRGYHTFYNHTDASAASLRDEDGKILARAVIFNKVHNCRSNETLRLCERQYAPECNLQYMKALVLALIKEGYIDGYKQVGADCHSPESFLYNNGEPVRGRMYIDLHLTMDDRISYQDSFKEFYYNDERAYNSEDGGDYCLDSTEGWLDNENDDVYDEYHQEYTSNNVVDVYYNGHWMTCDEEYLDDFVYVESKGNHPSGYYYYDEEFVFQCEICEEYVLHDDSILSELTGHRYCCKKCLETAEQKYKEENWYQSEYSGEYFPTDLFINVHQYGTLDTFAIHCDEIDDAIAAGEIHFDIKTGWYMEDMLYKMMYKHETVKETV